MDDIAEYRNYYIVAAEFKSNESTLSVNGLYSGTAIHSVPLTTNLLSNALIKTFVGKDHSIHVSRQQLPNTLMSSKIEMPEIESLSRVLIFTSFFFPIIALFVVHPLQETATKVKQLQRMTGVTAISYWATMFMVDFLILLASVLVITLSFCIMDIVLDIRLYHRVEIRKYTCSCFFFFLIGTLQRVD